jgi:TonB family protein
MINRLAIEALPTDVPAFLRAPEAIAEDAYLGPEPDRWRSRAEPELNAEQAPDHFIDLELADRIGTLPRQRYQYIAALYAYAATHPDQATEMRPEHIGFQPYVTNEVWERLKSAMRDYRILSAKHADTKPVEAAVLFYAGWLGHYVADGAQPLHVTIQYNGWVGPNPNGYTTAHTIHSQFESAFVDAAVNTSDVQPLVAPLKTIGDEWDDYLAYLRQTGTSIEKVYQLEKEHGFEGAGTPEAKQFTAQRLAAGASMLRDLIYAAWTKSAEPVPEWHDQHTTPAGSSGVKAGGTPTESPVLGSEIFRKPFPAGFVMPKLVYDPDPEFSKQALKHKAGGTVVIGMVVDKNGLPSQIHIVSSDSKYLVDGALNAARQYRFEPGRYNGVPVLTELEVGITFRAY